MEAKEMKIDIPGKWKAFGGELFMWSGEEEELVIPEGITEIKNYAFRNAAGLKRIALPDSLVGIAGNAFENCAALEEVVFGKGLERIGAFAFCRCESLTAVELPEGLKSLEAYAFERCVRLRRAVLPSRIKAIGGGVFKGCVSLEEVTIPEGIEELDSFSFDGCISLKEVSIPSTVKKLGMAFYSCAALGEVRMDAVGEIEAGRSVFYGCKNPLRITFAGDSATFEKIFAPAYEPPEYETMYDEKCYGKWRYPLGHPDGDGFVCEAFCVADGVTVKMQGHRVDMLGDPI